MTIERLQELWPEGWLGRRVHHTTRGERRLGDFVYVVPRKATNLKEITMAATTDWLDQGDQSSRLQVVWYWDDPSELAVERVSDEA